MAVRVRQMTAEEIETIRRLAHSRTEAAAKVERAKIIRLAHQGQWVASIAREVGVCAETVRQRIKRFNDKGLEALEDLPRPGRPATYTPEQVSEVIAAALTKPEDLGLPFACWTLDRLEAYLNEVKGIPIKRKQETWFGERVDPEFAEKGDHHKAVYRPTGW